MQGDDIWSFQSISTVIGTVADPLISVSTHEQRRFNVFHLHVLILQTRSGKNYIQGHWRCVLCPGYFHCISGHHKRRLSSQSVCHLDCSSCDQPLAFTLTTVTPILLCLWTGPPLSWKIWDLVFLNFKSVEWIKSNLLKSQFKCLVPVRY